MESAIKVEIDYNSIAVIINELPMLMFPIETFKGLQAWTDGNKYSI